jgi:hypothetical protein
LASYHDYVEEKTEVIYGIENITQKTLERLALTKHTVDSCFDVLHASTIISARQVAEADMQLKRRGVKSRVITEITKDNLNYCKEILKMATEVRHLDEVKGNFSISDQTTYQAMAVGNFLIPNKVSPSMLSSLWIRIYELCNFRCLIPFYERLNYQD